VETLQTKIHFLKVSIMLSTKETLAQVQCKCNILAVLEYIGFKYIPKVIELRKDRIFIDHDPAFIFRVENLLDNPSCEKLHFKQEIPNDKLHPGVLHSWRELVTICAMQVCEHQDKIELDIDIGGALTDAVGLFTHLGEILAHKFGEGKTNPFRIRKLLKRFRKIDVPEITAKNVDFYLSLYSEHTVS